MNALNVPLVFVPGNHDPDISGYRTSRAGLPLRAGLPARPPWPDGAISAEQRVVDAAGLRLAGLGGCRRYSDGPNQYTEWQQARRARALARRAWWRRVRDGRGVDVLLTHAPPEGVGDGADPPHQGFRALHRLTDRLQPAAAAARARPPARRRRPATTGSAGPWCATSWDGICWTSSRAAPPGHP